MAAKKRLTEKTVALPAKERGEVAERESLLLTKRCDRLTLPHPQELR